MYTTNTFEGFSGGVLHLSRGSGGLLSLDVVGWSHGHVDQDEEQSENLTLTVEVKFHLSGACWFSEVPTKRVDLKRPLSRRENELNENCSDLVDRDNAYCMQFPVLSAVILNAFCT